MKPIAVHLHLHYMSMWPKIKEYLQNLGQHPYHLYVTLTEDNPSIVKEIKTFCPQATVWLVENRGYDLGPFVDFVNKVDLSSYDLVLKIHTKNPFRGPITWLNGYGVTRKWWVKLLFSALLESPEVVDKNLAAFVSCPKLGMLSSRYVITSDPKCYEYQKQNIVCLLNKIGCPVPDRITFVAGTMFFVRASLLEKIKNKLFLADFALTDPTVKDETLAHAFERVLGCIVTQAGYEIKGFDKNFWFENFFSKQNFLRFFYSNDVTSHNHHIIKVCKIPVYYKNLNKQKRG